MAKTWDDLHREVPRDDERAEPETLSDGLYDQTPPPSFGFPSFLERFLLGQDNTAELPEQPKAQR